MSPDFLISFSVVIVVVPPGVAIFVSCFAVDLVVFVQPVIPIEAMPIINVATTMRFIWNWMPSGCITTLTARVR